MYKFIAYKYGRETRILTGKENVLPLFLIDYRGCMKRKIIVQKTQITAFFPGEKYSEKFILPITCKRYLDD